MLGGDVEIGPSAPTLVVRDAVVRGTEPSVRKGLIMGQPVVHFEIIGTDPAKLQGYYGELFGWSFHPGDAVTDKVSQPGRYGFVDGSTTGSDGSPGINGGVGGGPGYERRVLFYVGVADVEAALRKAEDLGGTRLMGPEPESGGDFAVGRFVDPEGNVVGVAGPSSPATREPTSLT
jgi:predicted enzyme related to lactoylglutathione lyase